MVNAALCIALFAMGHMIRDGWPATGDTNRGGRPIGAFFCLAGASAVLPIWPAVVVGSSILAGFYFDQKHGEGQNAGRRENSALVDALYLALSGVTSLIPLAFVAAYFHGFAYLAIALVGIAKPPIWFASWSVNPARWGAWAQPTRLAAILFGAAVGAAVSMGG